MPKKVLLAIFFLLIVGTIVAVKLLPGHSLTSVVDKPNVANQTDYRTSPVPILHQDNPAYLAATQQSVRIPILMYHHIVDYHNASDPLGNNLAYAPAKFAQDLDYLLANHFTPTTFRAILAGKLPDKPVILTFDDGYDDFYSTAYPAIKQRQLTAVVFVILNRIGQKSYLSLGNMHELLDGGIEFGSHSTTHADLTKVDAAQLEHEIVYSRQRIDELFHYQMISFCYPSGAFNDTVINAVQNAGFMFATTTKDGIANLASPFTLSRIRMTPDTNLAQELQKFK